ncbi:MlaA family lipoprotein [Acinetobacter tianfuensis]|uniref:VacJ family lipoprotein n=1 Tax=Acinetobacter tianfuensis TaxID=2419603 RepID=A0A3A8E4J2_9GAMM|nr:VacJ family lipoprotein [Acinetobacter tianfuensis]RKG29069.1 VacJ family lipoprotein [Acinetobacter tianfuensis]
MRHSSLLYVGLFSLAAAQPAFAAEQTQASELENTTSPAKNGFITKSEAVVKKLTVNANAAQADEEKDPFESVNRKVYAFNDALDRNIARPIAVQYVEKVPDEVRGSYRHFRKNLREPWNAVNQLIQGRPLRAAKSLGRFTINTVTTLGFADPARRLNLTTEEDGLGTTLGYYGLPTGPYLMLPFLGPSTIREGVGMIADGYAQPQRYLLDDHEGVYWSEQALRAVDSRSQVLEVEKVLQGDKYAQLRDIYLQRLSFEIAEKKGTADDGMFINDDTEDDDLLEDSDQNDAESNSDGSITDNSETPVTE